MKIISVLKSVLVCVACFVSVIVQAASVGDKAPQIIASAIDGSVFALSRAPARPKVVNFFWVECKPCKEEIPLLAQKEKRYPGIDFYVIHAQANPETETNYSIEDVQAFVDQLAAFPRNIMLGSPRLQHSYRIPGMPTTYLLSADNKVEGILIGLTETKSKLEPWLKKQPR